MNTVERMFQANPDPQAFSAAYARHVATLLEHVDHQAVDQAIRAILAARDAGKRIFLIGNGGSAATASHFANDIAIGTRSPEKPFRAMSLTDNSAVTTAISNDDGYEQVFVKQLEALMEPGDLLIAVSASGNSPNLVEAIRHAKSLRNRTIGLTGFDGGKMRQMCEIVLHFETEKGEYGPVESLHALLVHLIGNYLLHVVRAERAKPEQARPASESRAGESLPWSSTSKTIRRS